MLRYAAPVLAAMALGFCLLAVAQSPGAPAVRCLGASNKMPRGRDGADSAAGQGARARRIGDQCVKPERRWHAAKAARPVGLRLGLAPAAQSRLAVPDPGTASSPLLASIQPEAQRGSRGILLEALNVGEGAESGGLVAIQDDKVTLARDETEVSFPLSAFREIIFPQEQAALRARIPPPLTVWADKGEMLMARQIRGASKPEAVDITGYGWRGMDLPLASIRALASRDVMSGPAQGREEFDRIRQSPPLSSDRVAAASEEGERVITCIVESASEAGLNAAVGDARSTVPWGEVRWAVLSPGARPPERVTGHLVELVDGTRFRVQSFEIRHGALNGRDGQARFSVDGPLAERVAAIRVYSPACRYLSDIEPEKVSLQPFLDVIWPPRFDQSLGGGPITLAGKAYEKGIAMDARTEMTFALSRAYSRFYATVGVDDGTSTARGAGTGAANAASPPGWVVFRVLGDGRALFERGGLRSGDAPQPLALDIRNVDKLTLVADFGSGLSAGGNFADWADARVVR